MTTKGTRDYIDNVYKTSKETKQHEAVTNILGESLEGTVVDFSNLKNKKNKKNHRNKS